MERRDTAHFDAAIGDLSAYLDALRAWQAGSIEVERGEDPATVFLMLRRAASLLGLHVWTRRNGGSELYWVLER